MTNTKIKNNDLQQELADAYHTCTCGDSLQNWNGSFQLGTTKVLLANLSDPENEAPEGRIVFYKTNCAKCKNIILHGESAADYRATGERLLSQVAERVAHRLEISQTEAIRLLNPSMKRFGFKLEKPNKARKFINS